MINTSSPISMYYQLKEILLKDIQNGKWPAQTRIMSENEICAAYKVSRVTVRKAIELLCKEGYLYSVRGKGTYVKGKFFEQPLTHFYSFREELRSKGVESVSKMIAFTDIVADSELSAALAVEQGHHVFKIERIFFAGELPYARETSYIPCALCPELKKEQIEKNGLYNSLKDFNIYPTRASEKLKALLPDQQTADMLQMPAGSAAIYLTRTTYCSDTIVELNTSIVRGDMFVYSVELQQG